MAERGAQPGNTNAVRKPWKAALDRAIAQDKSERLRQSAEALLDAAATGDLGAINVLADRLDGKVPQAITGEDGGPLTIQILKFSDAVKTDGS